VPIIPDSDWVMTAVGSCALCFLWQGFPTCACSKMRWIEGWRRGEVYHHDWSWKVRIWEDESLFSQENTMVLFLLPTNQHFLLYSNTENVEFQWLALGISLSG
jgi:hypothetical protein